MALARSIRKGDLRKLRDILVEEAEQRRARFAPTGDSKADALLNDLRSYSHAFVLGCIVDRQMVAEKAWRIPWSLRERLGFFTIDGLARVSEHRLAEAMHRPTNLHRFPKQMAHNIHSGIARIHGVYGGKASRIWDRRPPSAGIVRRFLEFDGVGPKIATMAANILVRDFGVPVSDRYSIDISADRHVRRVFARLGFAPEAPSVEQVVYAAREWNPEWPGVFDKPLWDVGRDFCHEHSPRCGECGYHDLCRHAAERSS